MSSYFVIQCKEVIAVANTNGVITAQFKLAGIQGIINQKERAGALTRFAESPSMKSAQIFCTAQMTERKQIRPMTKATSAEARVEQWQSVNK